MLQREGRGYRIRQGTPLPPLFLRISGLMNVVAPLEKDVVWREKN
jgi:hypothetical protein